MWALPQNNEPTTDSPGEGEVGQRPPIRNSQLPNRAATVSQRRPLTVSGGRSSMTAPLTEGVSIEDSSPVTYTEDILLQEKAARLHGPSNYKHPAFSPSFAFFRHSIGGNGLQTASAHRGFVSNEHKENLLAYNSTPQVNPSSILRNVQTTHHGNSSEYPCVNNTQVIVSSADHIGFMATLISPLLPHFPTNIGHSIALVTVSCRWMRHNAELLNTCRCASK
ncbi:hypothetical protein J6590_015433 [Homalodisca vitripennis]|nr:hypothetical protein J6590_015433 [Homalodisca vitripennis]